MRRSPILSSFTILVGLTATVLSAAAAAFTTTSSSSISISTPTIITQLHNNNNDNASGRQRHHIITTNTGTTSILSTRCRLRQQHLHGAYRQRRMRLPPLFQAAATDNDSNTEAAAAAAAAAACWNPRLRQIMGGIAAAGCLETAYLTYAELAGQTADLLLCSAASTAAATTTASAESAAAAASSSCSSVLTGPYAHLPGTGIPLAALGFLAYATVLGLAVGPLIVSTPATTMTTTMTASDLNDDSNNNRVALTAVSTTMAVFSACLVTILVTVLHQSCAFCFASAACSMTMAALAWMGGALPRDHVKEGVGLSLGGALVSLAAAFFLVTAVNSDPASATTTTTTAAAVNVAGELVGSGPSKSKPAAVTMELQSPPAITTTSSATALALAEELHQLDATFYGAFWCSHCYDQKQAFGMPAMGRIPYVECSKEGVNAQVALCREKKVPGYPTWEIGGKLYPGEQALDELQEIVAAAKAAANARTD